jgi:hypothetical protein
MKGALSGLWFVLTGAWPSQGGGCGLTLSKERVKVQIEKFGGSITMSISGVTNVLVTGKNPGKKKVVEAHEKRLKIINIKQMNGLTLGDFTLDDLTISGYPEVVSMIWMLKRSRCSATPNHQSNRSRPRTVLLETLSQDKKMMLCQQGLATAMVRGVVHTTGTAARGVNASNSTAVGGGGNTTIKIKMVITTSSPIPLHSMYFR